MAGGFGGLQLAGSSRAYWRLPRFQTIDVALRCRSLDDVELIEIICIVVRIVQGNGRAIRTV